MPQNLIRLSCLLVLFLSVPGLAAIVPGKIVLKTTDPVAGSTVNGVNPPFTDATGRVGFMVNLADLRRAIWYDNGPIFLSSDALPDMLVGGEFRMGIASGGKFVYSPIFNGLDSLYTHAGVFVTEQYPVPALVSRYFRTLQAPLMLNGGAVAWFSSLADTPGGLPVQSAVFVASDVTNVSSIEIALMDGDIVDGFPLALTLGTRFAMSDNGQHLIHNISLQGTPGGTTDDGALWYNNSILARESFPTGDGDNWVQFINSAVNNHGDYLFTGRTNAAATSDLVLVANGAIVAREGGVLDGITLGGSQVRAIGINNHGRAAFLWDSSLVTTLFVGDVNNLAFAKAVLSVGDEIDVDNDSIGDWIVTAFKASSGDAAGLDPGDDGAIYVEVDLVPSGGGATREAIIRIDVAVPDSGPFLDRFVGPPLLEEYFVSGDGSYSFVTAGGGCPGCDGSGAKPGQIVLQTDVGGTEMLIGFDATKRVVPATDFDVRIHYRACIFTQPSSSASHIGMRVRGVGSGASLAGVSRAITNTGAGQYRAWSTSPQIPFGTVATADQCGWLRITRAGTLYTLLHWDFGTSAWAVVGSVNQPGIQPVTVEFFVSEAPGGGINAFFDDLMVMLPSDQCFQAESSRIELGRELNVDFGAQSSSNSMDDPAFPCNPLAPGLGHGTNWYRVSSPSTALRVVTYPDPNRSSAITHTDTIAAFFGGNCPPALGPAVGCDDDSCVLLYSSATAASLSPQTTYRLLLASWHPVFPNRSEAIVLVTSPILYVDEAAPPGGDGQSWYTAFNNPQDALARARQWYASAGCQVIDEIRIARGTYRPDGGFGTIAGGNHWLGSLDVNAVFELARNVRLAGGYRGAYDNSGLDPDDRDFVNLRTILSGDLLDDDDYSGFPDVLSNADNSGVILTAPTAVQSDFVLDGLTIERSRGTAQYHGGVRCISGGPSAVSLEVTDCLFVHHMGDSGPALSSENIQLTIRRTRFHQNRNESGFGGGLFYRSDPGAPEFPLSVTIEECEFLENVAYYAGAAQIESFSTTIERCLFESNSTTGSNNPILTIFTNGQFFATSEDGTALLSDCRFVDNYGSPYGTVGLASSIAAQESTAILDSCEFEENDTGGLFIFTITNARILNSVFRYNGYATTPFSAIIVATSTSGTTRNLLISDCEFRDNHSQLSGGAVRVFSLDNYDIAVLRSEFLHNSAVLGGGAIALHGLGAESSAILQNCRFLGNSSDDSGGAIYVAGFNEYVHVQIANCLLAGNQAGYNGGGVYVVEANSPSPSDLDVVNCTFADNVAADGGAIWFQGGHLTFVNSISWNHTVADFHIFDAEGVDVDRSIIGSVSGGPPLSFLSVDPLFVNPAGPDGDPSTYEDNDYSLALGSPAIDAGRNDLVPLDELDIDENLNTTERLPIDLAGNPRFVDHICVADHGMPASGYPYVVDAGAFETPPAGPITLLGDLDCSGAVNLLDTPAFVLALIDPAAYDAAYDCCQNADLNGDGMINGEDIAWFVHQLLGP